MNIPSSMVVETIPVTRGFFKAHLAPVSWIFFSTQVGNWNFLAPPSVPCAFSYKLYSLLDANSSELWLSATEIVCGGCSELRRLNDRLL